MRLAAFVVAGAAMSPAAPALGHAFGDPPRAWLHADGRVVTLDWVAAEDDAAAIGHAVGLLPEEAVWAFIEQVPEDLPTAEETRRLSESSELRDYLLEHVEVRQEGRPCAGVAEPAADFIADGAQLRFTCPDPVVRAHVRITLLHDQDEAYRTFSVDASDQLAIHSVARPEHLWDFTRDPDDGWRPDLPLVGGFLLVVAGLAGAMRLLGPRRDPAEHRSSASALRHRTGETGPVPSDDPSPRPARTLRGPRSPHRPARLRHRR